MRLGTCTPFTSSAPASLIQCLHPPGLSASCSGLYALIFASALPGLPALTICPDSDQRWVQIILSNLSLVFVNVHIHLSLEKKPECDVVRYLGQGLQQPNVFS